MSKSNRELAKESAEPVEGEMTYYPALIERAEDGGYGVTFPDLPGCTSGGATLDKALVNAAKGLTAHLAWMADDGDPIPAPSAIDAPLPTWWEGRVVDRALIPAAIRALPVPEAVEPESEVERLRKAKDDAYSERNMLVALLARLYPSGIARTGIEGWDPEWHGCVYIDTPEGQLSWHYHDSEAHLFADLPPYDSEWDGHTTEEKYARIRVLIGAADKRRMSGQA